MQTQVMTLIYDRNAHLCARLIDGIDEGSSVIMDQPYDLSVIDLITHETMRTTMTIRELETWVRDTARMVSVSYFED